MKEYWDEVHPELAFYPKEIYDSKQLKLKKAIMGTKYFQTQSNNNKIEINNVITNDDTTEYAVIETRASNVMNNIKRNNDSTDILRSSDQYKSLRECFITNYNTLIEKSLDERTTTINISKNIDKILYATIDKIVKEHLKLL